MPTYEYLCQTCSHRFETWQKMTDAPLTTCPECGAQIRRILFPTGIVFKGHGFYKTDHTSNGSSIAANSNGHTDNKKAETEAGSNGNAKKAEGSTSTSTSETGISPAERHGGSNSTSPQSLSPSGSSLSR